MSIVRSNLYTVCALGIALSLMIFASMATVEASYGPVTDLGVGREPHCALGLNGVLHIVFIDTHVRYMTLTAGVPSAVQTLPGSSGGRNPFICVGTDGSVHVVWDTWSTGYYTNRVGGTWKNPITLPISYTERNYFPQVAVTPDGTAYTSHWSLTKGEGGHNVFCRVTNTGSSTPTITKLYQEHSESRPPSIIATSPASPGDGQIHIFIGLPQTRHRVMNSNGSVGSGTNISRTPYEKTVEGMQGFFIGSDPAIATAWWDVATEGTVVNSLSRANAGKQGILVDRGNSPPFPRAAYCPTRNKAYILYPKSNKPALAAWNIQNDTIQQLGNVSEGTLSTGTRGPGAGGIARNTSGGVHIVYSTGGRIYHRTMDATPDTQPPSVPTNVQATSWGSTVMEVTWTASTDNVGVTGYKVFRNGNQVGTSTGTVYLDTGLAPSTTYSYTISAYDAQGNESAQSSPPAVGSTLAPDSEPPSVPTNVQASGVSGSAIRVDWTASTDNRGVLGYKIFRNGSRVGTIGATTNYIDTDLLPATTYSYTVSAFDGDGNESAQSSPPAVAATLSYCSMALGSINVSNMLFHPQNSDGDTVGAVVGGLNCRRPRDTGDHYFYFAIDDDFLFDEPGITTYVEVSYFDDQSNHVYIEPQYDSMGDGIGPMYRSAAPRVYLTNTGRWITTDWTLMDCKFANRQNAGADFRIYVGPYDVKISSVRVSLIPFDEHTSVEQDLGNNEIYSGLSHPQVSGGNTTVTTIGGRDCRKPTGSGDNYFYFNVSDAVMYDGNPANAFLKVTYYDSPGGMIQPQYDSMSGVYTNAAAVNFTGTNTWKQAYWLLENVRFANNQAGSSDFRLYVGTNQNVHIDNVVVSKQSFEPDTEPPSVPTDVAAITVTETSIELGWTASTDNVVVAGYRIFRNGSLAGTSTTTSYTDTGLELHTTYSYTVSAFDAAGNESEQSSPATVVTTLADTEAPSVPTGVSAEALSPTEVQVNWTASTDNVGVAGYRIFRNGALAGTSPTPGYLDSEVVSGVSYSYTVSAYDAAGNESAQSSPPAVVTTPDNVPPSVPTNVSATALSAVSIEIIWNASTDNVGVEGYKVFRDGELVGTTDETSYTDSGLEPETTYSYTVSAYDAVGNESEQSSPAVATTQSAVSVSEAKLLGDYSTVTLVSKIVSAVFDDFFYVKELDDYVGIRVVPTEMPEGLSAKNTVDITGVILTSTMSDERYIDGDVMVKY